MTDSLIKSTKSYLPDLDESRLQRAYDYAKEAHKTQFRKDGSPYISHPLASAEILTQLKVDEDTLIACLLHDVPEDTDRTIEDIEKEFGESVAFLVEGITKLSKVHYRDNMASRQIESLKKLFLHSAKDPRIILIKLADRLHNMQTIDAIENEEKRKRITKETLEIFVPIANLLGVWELKHPLEDACLKVLHPKEYAEIEQQIKETKIARTELIKESIKSMKVVLDAHKIEYDSIHGRKKNLYSIYQKMKTSGKSFNQIYDLIGLRVIVKDIASCYRALGAIHQSYTPKIGRLKDYIAIPKSNGYQSIHTSIFGIKGAITEIQIRTMDMHLENEYGIAAHYFYRKEKAGKQKQVKQKIQKKYNWVNKILELQKQASTNDNFIKNLKLDLFEDRIFVFTPKGDVIDLPIGATAIDFTYHIHSDLGLIATDCEINGKKQAIHVSLKNGDVVKINTSEGAKGPQINWLDLAKTNLAKTRIKEYLKEKDKNELISSAQTLLDRKFKYFIGRKDACINKDEKIYILNYFKIKSWEEFLINIGNGTLDVHEVMTVFFDYEMNSERIQHNKVKISMELEDKIGMLGKVCDAISNMGINILKVDSFPLSHNKIALNLDLQIHDYDQFENLIPYLIKIDGVNNIMKEIIDLVQTD